MRNIVNGLFIQGQKVLLAHRSENRGSYPDTWSFPGGHVEEGETFEEALVRELAEEIGVSATSWRSLDHFRYVNGGATFHFFAVDEWDGEPINLGQEHSEIRWVELVGAHKMPKLTFPVYANMFSELANT
jgi:mutator protein MutT